MRERLKLSNFDENFEKLLTKKIEKKERENFKIIYMTGTQKCLNDLVRCSLLN